MNEVVSFNARQMDLIRNTVASDCNPSEFDIFLHICQHTGLDPLRRQIYAFVFGKNDPKKRQMVPVVAIGGLRSMAERTGNYRPDMEPARLEISEEAKDPHSNPLGIVRAEVTVYKYAHGEWFPAVGEAYWDEYVPLIEENSAGFDWVETGEVWADSKKPKKKKVARAGGEMVRKIDAKKAGWVKMPRIMIAKCAEASALRKAWPDDFANLYEESELDQARTMDLSPSEMAELGGQEKRLEKIGGADAIMIDWLDGKPIERVALGRVADAMNKFIDENRDTPSTLAVFQDRNKYSLQEFWARSKSDALEIKKRFEMVEKALVE